MRISRYTYLLTICCTAREGERPPAPPVQGLPSLRKQEIIVAVFSPESEWQQNSAQLQPVVTNNQGRGEQGERRKTLITRNDGLRAA